MANTSWQSIGNESYSTGSYRFVKVASGESVIIRPVGIPVDFKKYMLTHNGEYRSAICLDENTCPVALKHNIRPKERWAINVINYKTNFIEIFENSPFIFKEFEAFYDQTGKNPGGTDGGKWKLSVSGVGINKKYALSFLGPHTLTDTDIALIKKYELYKLTKVYRAVDPNIIESVLLGDKKVYSPQPTIQKQDIEQIMKVNNTKAEPITLSELLG